MTKLRRITGHRRYDLASTGFIFVLWCLLCLFVSAADDGESPALSSLRGVRSRRTYASNNGTRGKQRLRKSRRLKGEKKKKSRIHNSREHIDNKLSHNNIFMREQQFMVDKKTAVDDRMPDHVVSPYELGADGNGYILGTEHLSGGEPIVVEVESDGLVEKRQADFKASPKSKLKGVEARKGNVPEDRSWGTNDGGGPLVSLQSAENDPQELTDKQPKRRKADKGRATKPDAQEKSGKTKGESKAFKTALAEEKTKASKNQPKAKAGKGEPETLYANYSEPETTSMNREPSLGSSEPKTEQSYLETYPISSSPPTKPPYLLLDTKQNESETEIEMKTLYPEPESTTEQTPLEPSSLLFKTEPETYPVKAETKTKAKPEPKTPVPKGIKGERTVPFGTQTKVPKIPKDTPPPKVEKTKAPTKEADTPKGRKADQPDKEGKKKSKKQPPNLRAPLPEDFPVKPEPKWGDRKWIEKQPKVKGKKKVGKKGTKEAQTVEAQTVATEGEQQYLVDGDKTYLVRTGPRPQDRDYELKGYPSWQDSPGRATALRNQKPRSFIYPPKKLPVEHADSDEVIRLAAKLTKETDRAR